MVRFLILMISQIRYLTQDFFKFVHSFGTAIASPITIFCSPNYPRYIFKNMDVNSTDTVAGDTDSVSSLSASAKHSRWFNSRPRGWICNRTWQLQFKGRSRLKKIFLVRCVSNPTWWTLLLKLTQVPSYGLDSKANVYQSLVVEELLPVENKCRLGHVFIDAPVIVTSKLVPAVTCETRF